MATTEASSGAGAGAGAGGAVTASLLTLPLGGRVAVVTGASGGIGAGIAKALASAGARVAIGARRLDALNEVKTAIESECAGSEVTAFKVDVTNRAEMKAFVAHAEATFGAGVDIMVNNAGVMYFTLMKNLMEDDWERTVDVNCKGVLNGIAAVLPGMLERKSGHIVNISSDAGRKVFPGLSVYSGSKFFVEAVSQGLRLETVGSGVKVTTIQPGNVDTPLAGKSKDEEGVKAYGEPSGAKVLSPSHIGDAVVYAVSQPAHVAVNEIMVEPRDEPC